MENTTDIAQEVKLDAIRINKSSNSNDDRHNKIGIDDKPEVGGSDSKIVVTESTIKADEDSNSKVDVAGDVNKVADVEQSMSNSWVFVDVKSAKAEKRDNTKKFYLDCSEEPVQELHEHELSVPNSGSESDTDGISVISESDAFKTDEEEATNFEVTEEQSENIKCEVEVVRREVETHGRREIVQVNKTTSADNKHTFTLNQIYYMTAFTVVIILIPLHWYIRFSNFDRKEIETPQDVLNILRKKKIDLHEQKYRSPDRVVIDDHLTYCTKIHEHSDYMNKNIRKCMKKLERAKEKLNRVHENLQNTIPESDDNTRQEDIEEIHLNYKAEYSKVNNNENKHEVYTKKVRYRKPHESKDKKNYEKQYKITRNTTNEEPKAYKFEFYSDSEFKKNHTRNESGIILEDRLKNDDNEHFERYKECEHELIRKEMYLREKEKFLQRKEQELRERELRSHAKGETTTKIREKINNVQNESSKHSNKYKTNEKYHNKEYEAKSSSNYESPSEHKNNHIYHHKTHKKVEKDIHKRRIEQKYKHSDDTNDDNVKDRDWYNELFEGRSKLRNNERSKDEGDWYNELFEGRSQLRNNVRSKDKGKSYQKTKSGRWYSRLFAGRAKLRKNTGKYFMKDDDFMTEHKFYSL